MVEKASKLDVCEVFFNTLNQVFIGFITIYMTFFCSKQLWTNTTNLHTYLCTIGYQLLMAEGMLALYGANVWSKMTTKKTKVLIHWLLQVAGSALAIAGNVIIIKSKRPGNHFISIHALTGLISFVFLVITFLNGILALFSMDLKQFVKPVYNKLFHNCMAIITFVVGMVSLIYGYETGFFRRNVYDSSHILWIQIGTGLTILLTLIGASKTMFNHVKGILY